MILIDNVHAGGILTGGFSVIVHQFNFVRAQLCQEIDLNMGFSFTKIPMRQGWTGDLVDHRCIQGTGTKAFYNNMTLSRKLHKELSNMEMKWNLWIFASFVDIILG